MAKTAHRLPKTKTKMNYISNLCPKCERTIWMPSCVKESQQLIWKKKKTTNPQNNSNARNTLEFHSFEHIKWKIFMKWFSCRAVMNKIHAFQIRVLPMSMFRVHAFSIIFVVVVGLLFILNFRYLVYHSEFRVYITRTMENITRERTRKMNDFIYTTISLLIFAIYPHT